MTNLTGLWHFFSTRDDEWFHRLGISELFFVGMSVELPLLYHRNLWCSIGCHEPCGSVADIASTPPYLSTEMCSETKVRLSTALAFGSPKMRLQTKWMFLTVSTTHKVKYKLHVLLWYMFKNVQKTSDAKWSKLLKHFEFLHAILNTSNILGVCISYETSSKTSIPLQLHRTAFVLQAAPWTSCRTRGTWQKEWHRSRGVARGWVQTYLRCGAHQSLIHQFLRKVSP